MAKPELSDILARLAAKGQPTPKPEAGPTPTRPMPLAEALEKGLPEADELAQIWMAFQEAKAQRANTMRGVDPRKPWQGSGEMEVGVALPPMEKVKLQNALARAKAGKRLTLADRKLLGRHELAKIMRRLRLKSGDLG